MAVIRAYSSDSHLDIHASGYRSVRFNSAAVNSEQISINRSADVKERDNALVITPRYDRTYWKQRHRCVNYHFTSGKMEIILRRVFVLTARENARSSRIRSRSKQFVNWHVPVSVVIKPICKRQLSFRRVALLPAFVSQLISRLLTTSTSSEG